MPSDDFEKELKALYRSLEKSIPEESILREDVERMRREARNGLDEAASVDLDHLAVEELVEHAHGTSTLLWKLLLSEPAVIRWLLRMNPLGPRPLRLRDALPDLAALLNAAGFPLTVTLRQE